MQRETGSNRVVTPPDRQGSDEAEDLSGKQADLTKKLPPDGRSLACKEFDYSGSRILVRRMGSSVQSVVQLRCIFVNSFSYLY